MNEDRFLANRQARETERKARPADDTMAEARMQFNAEVAEFSAEIAATLSATGADASENADAAASTAEAPSEQQSIDRAMDAWRAMQAKVADAVQTIRLTAYDVRTANAALAKAFNDIEQRRSATTGAATKRFRFTRKVRPLGTSFGQPADAKAALGAADDRCIADEGGPENAIADVTGGSRTLLEPSTAAFIRRCENATLFLAPVNGSCFMSDCRGCTLYVACHQMRINRCEDCEVYVWCRSTPVIEKSSNMRFGGYSAWRGAVQALQARDGAAAQQSLAEYAKAAGIDDVEAASAAHRHVADFTWLKKQASPNWRALDESQWAVVDASAA